MRAQILILIILAAIKHCGAEDKPMVTFTPNWRIIFIYESVTISCNIGSAAQENPRYYWSKDGKPLSHLQTIKIESASAENSGNYQCWVKAGLKSDPVRLDVVGIPLILQTPSVIYIGEPLTLRCHSFSSYQKTNTTFYKNKTFIQFLVNDTELRFTSVDWNVAGSYRCSQQIFFQEKYKTFNAMTIVSVQERPHTSIGEMTSMSLWILVISLLLLLSAALLIFTFRHKLRIRGRPQQHSSTEPARKYCSEEDEVCYMYIDTNHLQRALNTQRPESVSTRLHS
ncbi:low affinity immunoglobulin gamma Fc region receptor III-A-like [Rhinoderma darwinii]|uniref:low affinity immunoglobulin gamma Fc region receptor III-A-like n=1 Tax=Rhinoderma darwinii TaxID=43563 RepID=UPI003F66F8C9